MILFNSLLASTSKAEVDYREYSEDYNYCLREEESTKQRDKCAQEEYYRIRKSLVEIQNKLLQVPEFQVYNRGNNSLLKKVNNMEQYGFLYCEYMQAASEQQTSLPECLLQQIDFLYVDLYKLYQEVSKNKQ